MVVSNRFKQSVTLVVGFVALLWIIELINIVTGRALNSYGLYPRALDGLVGIVTAPLLHSSVWHLFSNSIPLLILGLVLVTHGKRQLLRATFVIVVLGGLLVWLFGRPSYHIGASGLVFGWWSFLIAFGFYQRDWKALTTAFIVLIFYGGMFFGLFVVRPQISFESHFFGAVAGIVAAAMLAKRSKAVV